MEAPIPPLPPPPPPAVSSRRTTRDGPLLRLLAHLSWITIIVSFFFQVFANATMGRPHTRTDFLLRGIISFCLAITGLGCGVIALVRNHPHRRRGVRIPARVGICVWLILFLIQIPIYLVGHQAAAQRHSAGEAAFQPVTHIPNGLRVQDAELGYSFELPPGYTQLPKDKMPGKYRLAYLKQSDGQAASIVIVEALGGTISPYEHMTAKYLPDKNDTLTPFTWRGLAVDGIRIPESTPAGGFVTFKAQIPIQKQAIQIGFGGPVSDEAGVHALAEEVLATLDGPVNW